MTLYAPATGLYGKHSDKMIFSIQSIDGNTAGYAPQHRGSGKNATDIFGDLMYTRSYQPRHEMWPIPLVEMERNTSLSQNEGW